jgi:ribosomal protein S24E
MEKLTVLNKKENPLLNRVEVEVSLETNISPKTSEAEEFVAKEFSTGAENVKIKGINGRFGSRNFIVLANIYKSKEEKDKTETRTKKEKKKKTEVKK